MEEAGGTVQEGRRLAGPEAEGQRPWPPAAQTAPERRTGRKAVQAEEASEKGEHRLTATAH